MQEILLSMGVVGLIGALLAVALELADRYIANYGEVQIDINDASKELTVEGGGHLLGALVNEGIFIPSACGGRGSCGYCKLKVESGAGPVLPTETSWVTPEEVRQNMRLSCQIKLREDIKIHIPEELFLVKEYRGKVEKVTTLTYDIKEVLIRLLEPESVDFKSGQYMQLTVPEYGDVDESVYRAYSLSSPSTENNYVEFIIRKVPEGICTTWVHDYLKKCDEVVVNGPHGDFYLRDTDAPIIMIGGGSGMAPFKGMLTEMAQKKNQRPVVLFFGGNTPDDIYHQEFMAQIEKQLPDFKFIPAIGNPKDGDGWEGETGLITEVVGRLTENAPESEAYLCGSPGMIDACINVLIRLGMDEEKIYFDKFT